MGIVTDDSIRHRLRSGRRVDAAALFGSVRAQKDGRVDQHSTTQQDEAEARRKYGRVDRRKLVEFPEEDAADLWITGAVTDKHAIPKHHRRRYGLVCYSAALSAPVMGLLRLPAR